MHYVCTPCLAGMHRGCSRGPCDCGCGPENSGRSTGRYGDGERRQRSATGVGNFTAARPEHT